MLVMSDILSSKSKCYRCFQEIETVPRKNIKRVPSLGCIPASQQGACMHSSSIKQLSNQSIKPLWILM